MERKDLLELFGRAPMRVDSALANIPTSAWHFKPTPAAWSIHEIIIHLADSEAMLYGRIRTCIATNGATIIGYDQDIWANSMNYKAQSAQKAIDLYKLLRTQTYHLLVNLPPELWEHYVNHSERGKLMLEDLVELYANHDHVAQIIRTHETWKISQQG